MKKRKITYQVRDGPYRMKGRHFKEVRIYSKKMTKNDIIRIAQEFSNTQMRKLGSGTIYVGLRFHTGWLSGKGTMLGDEVSIPAYDEYDDKVEYMQDYFDEIYLYIIPGPPRKGGADKNNDCLWYAIRDARNGVERLPQCLQQPWKLKRRLKLKRNEKIPIDDIPIVEDLFKYNINVAGDHTHTSTNNYKNTITIQLLNGHYSAPKDKKTSKILTKGFNEHPVVVFFEWDELVNVYDGEKLTGYTINEFQEYKQDHKYKTTLAKAPNEDVISYYKVYKKEAEKLKVATKGLINLLKNAKLPWVAKALFDMKSYNTPTPVNIDQLEGQFLEAFGALIYAEKGNYKKAIQYDINGMYSFFMKRINCPIKPGRFMKLNQLPVHPQYLVVHDELAAFPQNRVFQILQ